MDQKKKKGHDDTKEAVLGDELNSPAIN